MRCAVCGSTKITEEIKNEGYNQKKGIIGVALFGLKGAIVGTSGNKVIYYHCADCGAVINKTMNEFEEMSINNDLKNKYSDTSAESLIKFKKIYKNIEWDENDELIYKRKKASEIRICDNEVLKQCEEYIMKHFKVLHNDLINYMKELGFSEKILNDIPKEIARGDYRIKFLLEDNNLYYVYSDNMQINGKKLSECNYEIYKIYFSEQYNKEHEEFLNDEKCMENFKNEIIEFAKTHSEISFDTIANICNKYTSDEIKRKVFIRMIVEQELEVNRRILILDECNENIYKINNENLQNELQRIKQYEESKSKSHEKALEQIKEEKLAHEEAKKSIDNILHGNIENVSLWTNEQIKELYNTSVFVLNNKLRIIKAADVVFAITLVKMFNNNKYVVNNNIFINYYKYLNGCKDFDNELSNNIRDNIIHRNILVSIEELKAISNYSAEDEFERLERFIEKMLFFEKNNNI